MDTTLPLGLEGSTPLHMDHCQLPVSTVYIPPYLSPIQTAQEEVRMKECASISIFSPKLKRLCDRQCRPSCSQAVAKTEAAQL